MCPLPHPDPSGERVLHRRTSNPVYEWPLHPAWRAALFLLLVLSLSSWLSYEVIRVAWLAYEADIHYIPDLEKALRIDPDNYDIFHRLGLVYSYEPTDLNPSEGKKYLRRAAELNPRRWDFWADLGATCDFAGDTVCSDEAYGRAQPLNPMTPSVQWAIGNHYILTDRPEKAFPSFRKLLDMDPSYLGPIFRLCLRATGDPQGIYKGILLPDKDPAARFTFLMHLSTQADYESAMRIWGQMITGPDRSPNLSMVKPFLDFLLDHNQIQDAATVWNDLEHAGVIPQDPISQAGGVYDGGFEGPVLNTGFAWRSSDSPDLVLDFSAPSAHKGAKCLRIDFAVGRNGDYEIVNQVVQVKPEAQYELTAYVRSETLTSDTGPRLRVVEMGCGDCPVGTSDSTEGTTPWHPVEVGFTTRPQTQAVKISFWRPQDQTSHRDITGTVWLDDVTLRPVEAPRPIASQARTR